MSGFFFDVRVAARGLARRPALTLGALATLGIGIGANLALFSVLHDVVLRELPFQEADRLVALQTRFPDGSELGVTAEEIQTLHDQLASVEGVATALLPGMDGRLTLATDRGPELVEGVRVSANFMDVLGARPARGPGIQARGPFDPVGPAVLLSDAAWRGRFGADPSIVGTTLELRGRSYEVAGVMPADFEFRLGSAAPELYLVRPLAEFERTDNVAMIMQPIARLRAGVSTDDLRAELARLTPDLEARRPADGKGATLVAAPLRTLMIGDIEAPVRALAVAAVLVLLVACANLATLFVARQSERGGEQALRAALGAGRRRLVRVPMAEAALLGIGGGALGLLLASVVADVVVAGVPDPLFRYQGFRVSPTLAAYGVALSLTAGVLFGAIPAWLAGGARPAAVLRATGRSGRGGSSRSTRVLAGAEAAVLVVLLAATGLALRSLDALLSVDLGFESEGRAVATLIAPAGRYATAEAIGGFFLDVEERVRALPGVAAAGTITHLPLDAASWSGSLTVEGQGEGEEEPRTEWELASPGYFEAAGVTLLEGRVFTPEDEGDGPLVTVVSRSLARRIGEQGEVIGTRISGTGAAGPWMTVVGVVEDVRQKELGGEPRPFIYMPRFPGFPFPERELVLAAGGDPMRAMRAAEEALRTLEPDLVVARARPMETLVERAAGRPRLVATLLAAFGAASLLLALTGIYGVTAYAAARRRREMGIRACLGAPRRELLARTVSEALAPVAVGAAVGLVAVLVLAPRAGGLLYGVDPRDALTLLAVPALLLAVTAAAAWGPARRVSRLDPGRVLREG